MIFNHSAVIITPMIKKMRKAKYKHLSYIIDKKNMPFVTPLFVYLQFVYKLVRFYAKSRYQGKRPR